MSAPQPRILETYNSLTDKHLVGYFSNARIRRHLQKSGLISRSGRIIPEREYRLNAIRRDHQRHVQQCLADAIYHKVLDIEHHRQLGVNRRLDSSAGKGKVQPVKMEGLMGEVSYIYSPHPPVAPRSHHALCPLVSGERAGRSQRRGPRLRLDYGDGRYYYRSKEPAISKVGQGSEPRFRTPVQNMACLSPYQPTKRRRRVAPVPPPRPHVGDRCIPGIRRGLPVERWFHPTTAFNEQFLINNTNGFPKSPLCSNALVTMIYLGKSKHVSLRDHKDEIKVYQQYCGTENICVYKGDLLEGDTFQFISKRYLGYPFSLTFYLNGLQVDRLSCCCEYRGFQSKRPSRLRRRNTYFRVLHVAGAPPCYRCFLAMGLDKKLYPPKRKMKVPRRSHMCCCSPYCAHSLPCDSSSALQKSIQGSVSLTMPSQEDSVETIDETLDSEEECCEEEELEEEEVEEEEGVEEEGVEEEGVEEEVEEEGVEEEAEVETIDQSLVETEGTTQGTTSESEYDEDFEADEEVNEEGQTGDQMNGMSKSSSDDKKHNLDYGKESETSSQKALQASDSEKDKSGRYSGDRDSEDDLPERRPADSLSSMSTQCSTETDSRAEMKADHVNCKEDCNIKSTSDSAAHAHYGNENGEKKLLRVEGNQENSALEKKGIEEAEKTKAEDLTAREDIFHENIMAIQHQNPEVNGEFKQTGSGESEMNEEEECPPVPWESRVLSMEDGNQECPWCGEGGVSEDRKPVQEEIAKTTRKDHPVSSDPEPSDLCANEEEKNTANRECGASGAPDGRFPAGGRRSLDVQEAAGQAVRAGEVTGPGQALEQDRAAEGDAGSGEAAGKAAGAGAALPQDGTGAALPQDGTGAALPQRGTGDALPQDGTGDALSQRGTGDALPQGGTGDALPQGGTGDALPQDGTGDALPQGGTGDALSQRGTGDALPQDGTGDALSQRGTGDALPQDGTGDALSQRGTGDALPQDGTGDALPQDGTGDALPQRGTGDALPQDSTGDALPQRGTGAALSQGGTGDALSQGGTGDALSQGGTGDALPQGGTGDALPQDGTGDALSQRGTGAALSQGGTGDALSQGGTGDALSQGGTGDALPQGGTGDALPQDGTGDALPQGGTGDALSQRGTGDALSQDSTGDALPQGGTGDALPQGGTGDALPQRGTGDALPQDSTGDALPQRGPGDALPQRGTGDALPQDGTGDALPQGGTGDALSQRGPGDALPQDGTGDALSQDSTGDALPQRGTGDALPQDGTGDALPQGGTGDALSQGGTGDALPQDGTGDALSQGGTGDALEESAPEEGTVAWEQPREKGTGEAEELGTEGSPGEQEVLVEGMDREVALGKAAAGALPGWEADRAVPQGQHGAGGTSEEEAAEEGLEGAIGPAAEEKVGEPGSEVGESLGQGGSAGKDTVVSAVSEGEKPVEDADVAADGNARAVGPEGKKAVEEDFSEGEQAMRKPGVLWEALGDMETGEAMPGGEGFVKPSQFSQLKVSEEEWMEMGKAVPGAAAALESAQALQRVGDTMEESEEADKGPVLEVAPGLGALGAARGAPVTEGSSQVEETLAVQEEEEDAAEALWSGNPSEGSKAETERAVEGKPEGEAVGGSAGAAGAGSGEEEEATAGAAGSKEPAAGTEGWLRCGQVRGKGRSPGEGVVGEAAGLCGTRAGEPGLVAIAVLGGQAGPGALPGGLAVPGAGGVRTGAMAQEGVTGAALGARSGTGAELVSATAGAAGGEPGRAGEGLAGAPAAAGRAGKREAAGGAEARGAGPAGAQGPEREPGAEPLGPPGHREGLGARAPGAQPAAESAPSAPGPGHGGVAPRGRGGSAGGEGLCPGTQPPPAAPGTGRARGKRGRQEEGMEREQPSARESPREGEVADVAASAGEQRKRSAAGGSPGVPAAADVGESRSPRQDSANPDPLTMSSEEDGEETLL